MPVPEIKFTQLFIDNEFVDSVSGKTFTTIDPATEEVICSVSHDIIYQDLKFLLRGHSLMLSRKFIDFLTLPPPYTVTLGHNIKTESG